MNLDSDRPFNCASAMSSTLIPLFVNLHSSASLRGIDCIAGPLDLPQLHKLPLSLL